MSTWLQRLADAHRLYGARRASLMVLTIIAKALYSDERHMVIVKRLDAEPQLDAAKAFSVQPLETPAQLERVAAGTQHYLLRHRSVGDHLRNGYRAQLATSTTGEPLGYLWWARREIDSPHPDVVLHQIDLGEEDAYIFSLFATPAGRVQSVARAVLRRTEAVLRERGYKRMVGWVDATNRPARWLFSTNGFEVADTVRVRFVFTLLAFSRGRVLVRNFGLRSGHRFGYRVISRGRGDARS